MKTDDEDDRLTYKQIRQLVRESEIIVLESEDSLQQEWFRVFCLTPLEEASKTKRFLIKTIRTMTFGAFPIKKKLIHPKTGIVNYYSEFFGVLVCVGWYTNNVFHEGTFEECHSRTKGTRYVL